jgi:transcription antitermination factor NusG
MSQVIEKNIQAYLPVTNEKRKWSDRIKNVITPLFPSYVFTYLNNVQDYYHGMAADGACCYVRFGNQLARVSDNDICSIRMIEKNGENIEVTSTVFQPGQLLNIRKGPLAGLTCEVIQYKSKSRILVRVDMLQRNLIADLPYAAFLQN